MGPFRLWLLVVVAVPLTVGTEICFAQTTLNDTLREMEIQRKQTELEIERARIQSREFEADMARMRAGIDSMNDDSRRMLEKIEAQAAAKRTEQVEERREEIARAAAQKAEERASELRDEITLAGVKIKNSFYLIGLVAAFVGFGAFAVKINRREVPMKENEKFGLATVIVSFLLALLSLMVSEGWFYKLDFLSNLMTELKIKFLTDDSGKFLVEFPTKYLVLLFISSAAYGVTTYLGITLAPWKKKINEQKESTEPPHS